MIKVGIVLGMFLYLGLTTLALACGGSSISSAGNTNSSQVSIAPARTMTPQYVRVVEFVKNFATEVALTLLSSRLTPVTGTLAPTLLNPENVPIISKAWDSTVQQGKETTGNSTELNALQMLEAQQDVEYGRKPR